jgi:molybdenum cofactor sulfurtransferase
VSRDRPCLTLMDAAGLASTTGLDLSDPYASPDFTTLSFYKIFGLPDLGALVVRKRSSAMMENRRYFGGGTVDMVINKGDAWHAAKRDSVHDYLEDGTLPFHSIIALDHAMSVHERLYGPDPMRFISMHTTQLGAQLHRLLTQMRHSNGAAVIRTYGDDSVYGCSKKQGAVVALNVLRADRTFVGSSDVERDANAWDIYIRSGSLCNPGGVATYLEWASEDMRLAYADGHRCSNPVQFALGKPTGVVRVSLGAMSTRSDVDRFLQFIRQTYVQ